MLDSTLETTFICPIDQLATAGRGALGRVGFRWYRKKTVFSNMEERSLSQQIMEVRVSTLGSFRVNIANEQLELHHDASHKVLAMLVFSEEHTCERETIAGTLWPDSTRSNSLASLRQTIFQLKKSVAAVCGDSALIKADANRISLVNCSIDFDIKETINDIKSKKLLENYQSVKKRITDGLLSEISTGSDLYSEWIASCESSIVDELKNALQTSIESSDTIELNLQYAKLLCAIDPCNELACRSKMLAYHASGEKGKALECYSHLWRQLEEQYDIEPSNDTQELAVAIKLGQTNLENFNLSTHLLSEKSEEEHKEAPPSQQNDDSEPTQPPQEPDQSIVPRVAVVPFVGRGVTTEQKFIGEVLADDLINIFSKCNTISVISRLSSSVFSGITGNQQAMQLLQVQYLMTGSYRVQSDKIVLDVEFSCAKTSSILWQKRFTGSFNEFLQENHPFVEDALHGMGISVMANELRKTTFHPLDRLDDYTLLVGAIAQMHRLTIESFKRSKKLFETLLKRNPKHALPYAYLSMWYVLRVVQGWSDEPEKDGEIAARLSTTALDLDPFLSLAHTLHGFVNTNLRRDLELGESCYCTALEHNQSDSLAWLLRGALSAFNCQGEKAVSYTSKAMAISPFDPHRYFYYSLAGTAAISAEKYDDAIDLAQKSLTLNREHASTLRVLIVSLWKTGRFDESKKTACELIRVQSKFTVSFWLKNTPVTDPLASDIASVLIEAGIPK